MLTSQSRKDAISPLIDQERVNLAGPPRYEDRHVPICGLQSRLCLPTICQTHTSLAQACQVSCPLNVIRRKPCLWHANLLVVQARAKKAESKRKLDELQKDISSLESITEEQVQAERDPIPAMLQVSLSRPTKIHCLCLASLIHETCCSKCLGGCKVNLSHKDQK